MSIARFRAMGCEVVVGGALERELVAIRRLFCEQEKTFSRFVVGSELNRVNASQEEAVIVSHAFARALRQALETARATAGLVDPTIGAAIVAAGYDRDFAQLHSDPRPPEFVRAGRWRAVRVLGRIVLRPAGVLLDLNGVVKGLTVDDALALVSGSGFVSAGGDLAVSGDHVVALPAGGMITVRAGGLATSGMTSRTWSRGGRLQHHLIDPRTARPSDSRWREVTASGADCLTADIAAKTAFLLDGEGPAWLDRQGLAGRFLSRHGGTLVNDAWRRAMELTPRAEPLCI
jgi:thiamine biosynthesis lipoprotein